MDERSFINGLKTGREECFIELVNLYKKKIFSLCYSYTRDYQEAEDLSQEVFLKLYNVIDTFREECSLSTYIYRIAVSKCIDFKRKKSIKNFLTGLINKYGKEDFAVEDKDYVRSCVLSLPEDLKIPIILYYYMGLSQKEIGEILNLSQKSIEGRIYRAKKKLKNEFERGGYYKWSREEMI